MLVDSHDLFRAALRTLLESSGINVVGDCASAAQVFDRIDRAKPDVLLTDLRMDTGPTGFELIETLNTRTRPPKSIVLTATLTDVDVVRSVRCGAVGYLLKETPTPELVSAIHVVRAGGSWLSPTVTATVLSYVRDGKIPAVDAPTSMSDREISVLKLLARGFDNNQIADELCISAKTVKNHISSIFGKIDASNRVQAAVYAVRGGIA